MKNQKKICNISVHRNSAMHVRRIRFLYVKEYVLSSVIASLLNHSILNKMVEKSVIEDSENYFIH